MNRARRTALTATIAAAVVGGASAVVAASAAEPTAGAETSSTASSSPSATESSTADPREAALRASIGRVEDKIAALKLLAARAAEEPATRTAYGSGSDGAEDAGVHQNRGGGAHEAVDADEADHADEADEVDEADEPSGHDEPGDDD
jgi:hypothetical protein